MIASFLFWLTFHKKKKYSSVHWNFSFCQRFTYFFSITLDFYNYYWYDSSIGNGLNPESLLGIFGLHLVSHRFLEQIWIVHVFRQNFLWFVIYLPSLKIKIQVFECPSTSILISVIFPLRKDQFTILGSFFFIKYLIIWQTDNKISRWFFEKNTNLVSYCCFKTKYLYSSSNLQSYMLLSRLYIYHIIHLEIKNERKKIFSVDYPVKNVSEEI